LQRFRIQISVIWWFARLKLFDELPPARRTDQRHLQLQPRASTAGSTSSDISGRCSRRLAPRAWPAPASRWPDCRRTSAWW